MNLPLNNIFIKLHHQILLTSALVQILHLNSVPVNPVLNPLPHQNISFSEVSDLISFPVIV